MLGNFFEKNLFGFAYLRTVHAPSEFRFPIFANPTAQCESACITGSVPNIELFYL